MFFLDKASKKRSNKYKSGSLTCTNKLTDDDLSALLESSKCIYSNDSLFLSNLELSEKDFLNFFTYLSSYKKITPCLYLTNSIFSEEHIKLAFLALERYTSLANSVKLCYQGVKFVNYEELTWIYPKMY